MAFTYAVTGGTVMGDLRVKYGTFTNGENDEGGAIVTSLDSIFFYVVNVTSHVDSAAPKTTNSAGSLTVDIPSGADGTWAAFGK